MFRSLTLLILAVAMAAPAAAKSAAVQYDPYDNSFATKPAEKKPVETKPVEAKPVEPKPEPRKAPARKPSAPQPMDDPLADNSYHRIGNLLRDKLADMDWGDGVVGVLVQDADYPLTAFAQNETQAMAPAGLLQIVTAAAALDILGPEFRFTTRLTMSGQVARHQLQGSVVVIGDGDPTLSARFLKNPKDVYTLFDKWAKLLRKQKIKKIAGPVIGDDRAFDDQWQGPGWPLERLGSPDLPSVAALNFNHNCVDITWLSTRKPGTIARYETFPNLPQYVFFANKVVAQPEAPLGRKYSRERTSNVISVSGAVPVKTEIHERAAIEDPARFFAEAFKVRLVDRGIAVTGPALAANKTSPAEVPGTLKELDAHPSPPLKQILAEMMRYDLALYAEVVFKTLGRQGGKRAGSFEAGQDAVRGFIDRLHLPVAMWPFIDGSGLSRVNRISPAQLLALMRAMRRGGQGAAFDSLFARAWEPGTLEGRFRPPQNLAPGADVKSAKKKIKEASQEAPPIWAKSGSAEGVEALAGYADTHFGRKLAFVIMVSGSRMPPAVLREQIDALVLTITQ